MVLWVKQTNFFQISLFISSLTPQFLMLGPNPSILNTSNTTAPIHAMGIKIAKIPVQLMRTPMIQATIQAPPATAHVISLATMPCGGEKEEFEFKICKLNSKAHSNDASHSRKKPGSCVKNSVFETAISNELFLPIKISMRRAMIPINLREVPSPEELGCCCCTTTTCGAGATVVTTV